MKDVSQVMNLYPLTFHIHTHLETSSCLVSISTSFWLVLITTILSSRERRVDWEKEYNVKSTVYTISRV